MTGSLDPWRTLGLVPGSSLDEIRRAYRRLAKANHPDAAGEGALPRFLAIQSAYEALAGPQRGRRPGARPAPAARDDAWRSTRAGGRPSGASSGATSGPRRPAAGARPSGARPSGSSGAGAGSADETGAGRGATDGPAGRRPSGRPTEAGTPRRPGSRRRAPNRATPGSTSYDAADEEPFEPGWTGATWYGASSGTYWTINPKEYADPRKHGPEYQRRARRSASGAWIVEDADGDEPAGAAETPDAGRATDPSAPRRAARPRSFSRPAPPDAAPDAPPVAAPGPEASSHAWQPGEREGRAPGGPSAAPSAEASPPAADLPPSRAWPMASGSLRDGAIEPLLRTPGTPAGRLGLALLGWPPLGVAAATAIGETTGCARFSASCGEVFSPGMWIVQVAIILLLLAVPRLAAWSAVGTLVALATAVPTAVVLSASGGSNAPETSAGVLVAVLGLAYVAGVGAAVVHRWWPSAAGRRVP